MTFFQKIKNLFRRKPQDLRVKIDSYLKNPTLIQKTINRQIDIVFLTKWTNVLPSEPPHFDLNAKFLNSVNLPSVPQEIINTLTEISFQDFASDETKKLWIEALIQPGPQPKIEVYKSFLMQDEVSEWIVDALQKIFAEINQKLNPLSSFMKNSTVDTQVRNVIKSFLPKIQESILGKLTDVTSDQDLLIVMKNSIAIAMQLSLKDFQMPPENELENSRKAIYKAFQSLLNDKKALEKSYELYRSFYAILIKQYGDSPLSKVFFDSDNNYNHFKTTLSEQFAKAIVQANATNSIYADELENIWKDIQTS
ncbi:hypothetical protein [Leptospira sp. GIMC2001]|uniref:hypothetical protein n=1 Tax=Leptospira sp. GIMC2001 TaxID=1513297 RepID=UPI002349F1B1|nr:hypothetical protein [Leptospira sp. GIMC2001]WCL49066.1 hypothetical protein O4O04_17520 [Leptospira sp. GIMC2001]